MSIRMKLISLVTAFILVLGLIITGVLAASQQMTLTGSVTFNVTDKSLWVKSLSIKKDNVNEEPVSDFLPGYINNNFNITIPPMTNNYGSFTLHFEIINTTTTAYSVTVDCSAYTSSGVTATASPSRIQASESEITNITSSTPTTTLDITITNPNGTTLDLSNIVITIEEAPSYQRVDADGTPNESGDYILFGYYPQTIKSADVTVDTSSTDERGYYLGSDGEYYAQVVANPRGSNYTFSDGTSVTSGETYYFKVEPLMWRILDDNYGDGTALILCVGIVDISYYQSNYYYDDEYFLTNEEGEIITENGEEVFALNYEYSELREFINNDFYNSAFSQEEKEYIIKTLVDNSPASTGNTVNQYACDNTLDNIFVLSYTEFANTEYGFQDRNPQDTNKRFMTNDYSCAKGLGNSNTVVSAWTRSPYGDYLDMYIVNGMLLPGDFLTSYGVVPALQIQL